jgi:hypothetical protein
MIEGMNFVLWISSGFWGKDPTVLSPISASLNEMISLRNKLLMKRTGKYGDTRTCRAVPEVIASNTNLPSFSY